MGTFVVEGERGPCVVSRRWKEEADFDAAETAVQLDGRTVADLDSLGWSAALRTHRPFLSYNELGPLLDEGPSKLYDALSSILGLEDFVQALAALQETRRSREKALKEATDARGRLRERLGAVDDPRARRVAASLEAREWDLGAIDEVLAGTSATGAREAEIDVLRGIAAGTVSAGFDRPARAPSAAEDQAAHRAAIPSCRGERGARAAREGGRDRQDRAGARRIIA